LMCMIVGTREAWEWQTSAPLLIAF